MLSQVDLDPAKCIGSGWILIRNAAPMGASVILHTKNQDYSYGVKSQQPIFMDDPFFTFLVVMSNQ